MPEALEDADLDNATGGKAEVRTAGLRSDGELVQASKAKPGSGHVGPADALIVINRLD